MIDSFYVPPLFHSHHNPPTWNQGIANIERVRRRNKKQRLKIARRARRNMKPSLRRSRR